MNVLKEELFVKMVLDSWFSKVEKADKIIHSLSEEAWSKDISYGKNSGHYLLGHIIAVQDSLLALLGFGNSMYPQLFDMFVIKPDKAVKDLPSPSKLKEMWIQVNEKLNNHFKNTSAVQWFEKHTSVSEEDFIKEPHRNKLNVVISRTNHLEYHLGQLILLK